MGKGNITATTKPKSRERERNPDRSREHILDAAEQLFAEKGYEETSLADVGRLAGVSRATPGYFFGSKAELHRAVLERCFADVRRAVREGRARALASAIRARSGPSATSAAIAGHTALGSSAR